MLTRVRRVAAIDVSTAVGDLGARPIQAKLISLHAFAFRADLVLLPVAVILPLFLAVSGTASAGAAAAIAIPILLAPQVVAWLITLVLGFIPGVVTLSRGSHEQRVRFAFGGGMAYLYYGWRYAFRGRTRPWGALAKDEKIHQNPKRMGLPMAGADRE